MIDSNHGFVFGLFSKSLISIEILLILIYLFIFWKYRRGYPRTLVTVEKVPWPGHAKHVMLENRFQVSWMEFPCSNDAMLLCEGYSRHGIWNLVSLMIYMLKVYRPLFLHQLSAKIYQICQEVCYLASAFNPLDCL